MKKISNLRPIIFHLPIKCELNFYESVTLFWTGGFYIFLWGSGAFCVSWLQMWPKIMLPPLPLWIKKKWAQDLPRCDPKLFWFWINLASRFHFFFSWFKGGAGEAKKNNIGSHLYSETLNLPQTPVHTVFFDTFVIWPKLNTIFHAKIKIEQSFQL